MLFSSISFLYYFLPFVLLVYFVVPKNLKNPVLLLFSLLFYAWGEPKYVFLMIATIAFNYVLGLLIERYRGERLSKVFMIASVVFCIGALGYFKYLDFFITNFNRATGLSVELLNIALPIGISFYTFQILSYIIDVYKGHVKAQKNIISLATYVTLFPQLIAGPIVRYIDIERELSERKHSFEKISKGIRRFVIGLSKKVLLANTLGELCEAFYSSNEKTTVFYWVFAVSYMLQVYFDFSGYSDMAIGIGKILGFEFLENFNYPFISRSITEFWRRWHISLGSWFRDYVYIPMGGNRGGKAKLFLNIFTVWFLTGFWHGAEWNFIVWGLYFGVLLTLEKLFLRKYIDKSKILGHLYVLFLVSLSFVIFSGNSMPEAISYVKGLFGGGENGFINEEALYNLRSYATVIIISAIASTPLPKKLLEIIRKNITFDKIWNIVEIFFLGALLIVSTAYLADGAFNPFLYFRF